MSIAAIDEVRKFHGRASLEPRDVIGVLVERARSSCPRQGRSRRRRREQGPGRCGTRRDRVKQAAEPGRGNATIAPREGRHARPASRRSGGIHAPLLGTEVIEQHVACVLEHASELFLRQDLLEARNSSRVTGTRASWISLLKRRLAKTQPRGARGGLEGGAREYNRSVHHEIHGQTFWVSGSPSSGPVSGLHPTLAPAFPLVAVGG